MHRAPPGGAFRRRPMCVDQVVLSSAEKDQRPSSLKLVTAFSHEDAASSVLSTSTRLRASLTICASEKYASPLNGGTGLTASARFLKIWPTGALLKKSF